MDALFQNKLERVVTCYKKMQREREAKENQRNLSHRRASVFFDKEQLSKLKIRFFSLPIQSRPEKYAKSLMNNFRKGDVLEWEHAFIILQTAARMFRVESNIVHLTVYPGIDLTICGDLHGQLPDLLTIFRLRGLPSANNWYVFNGDVVDRGEHGVECLLLILAFKIAFPRSVFVNRGNHETRSMNEKYGFADEVRAKYGRQNQDIFHEVFRTLPLATCIQGKAIVLHGGLFSRDGVTLGEISHIDRFTDPPTGMLNSLEDQVFEEILWSDPVKQQGRTVTSRGAGIGFGPDVTKDFLQRNNLHLLIRSHEVVSQGYQVSHDYRLITIFSASNYCGFYNNFGAVIAITENLIPTFVKYRADNIQALSGNQPSIDVVKQDVLKRLQERIVDSSDEMWRYYKRVARGSRVTRLEWVTGISSSLNLKNIYWLTLFPYLATAEVDGRVDYVNFVKRYQIQLASDVVRERWEDLLLGEVCERVYLNKRDISSAFAQFDTGRTSLIPFPQFIECLHLLDLGLTDDQLADLSRVFANAEDEVNYEEFLERFELMYTIIRGQHNTALVAQPEDTESGMRKLAKHLEENVSLNQALVTQNGADPQNVNLAQPVDTLLERFQLRDGQRSGVVSRDSFNEVMNDVGLSSSSREADHLFLSFLAAEEFSGDNLHPQFNYVAFHEAFQGFYITYTQEQQEKRARKEEEKLCRRLLREVSKMIPDVPGVTRLVAIGQVFLGDQYSLLSLEQSSGPEKARESADPSSSSSSDRVLSSPPPPPPPSSSSSSSSSSSVGEGISHQNPLMCNERISYEAFSEVCRKLLASSTTRKLRRIIVANQGSEAETISDDLLFRIAKFVDKEERGVIILSDLVTAFRFVEMKRWRKQVLKRITSEFFHNRYRLMRAFRCFEFDEPHGKIGQEGFKAGLRAINIILNKKALSDMQVERLHEALDTDGDGYIDYEEFLDFFRVYDIQKLELKRQQKMEAKMEAKMQESVKDKKKKIEEQSSNKKSQKSVKGGGGGEEEEKKKRGEGSEEGKGGSFDSPVKETLDLGPIRFRRGKEGKGRTLRAFDKKF
eukprot:CAMPEP_0201502682 /NCGR_PEP_ID=MMETSP0151_2-20130828/84261_1 /ASSEMBLY_ACC=CAM_ASM_000257 /TAXON_ID=200890 /ORGANISM="Paramoeba atlantica, Strain 621/1 / CCAP 1560/9" /LENGTH=1061 /DNA_ID=CAMNT_0047896295 /DNA_START=611 /DNA_END=3796 /DNA_ORIENTATION=-